jgi:hypothetical protein
VTTGSTPKANVAIEQIRTAIPMIFMCISSPLVR